MSDPDDEVILEVTTLLERHFPEYEVVTIVDQLYEVIHDQENGPKFTRLIQKWSACV